MNLQELQSEIKLGSIKEHHTSLFRGYVSRKGGESEPTEYDGKFGRGYTTISPNFKSTQYSYITYYIFTT